MDVLANANLYSRLQNLLAPNSAMSRLASMLGICCGDRVLDVGCGPADILEYLPEGIDYTGFDISERYIAAAKRRYGERGKFSVMPVSQAAGQDAVYDSVIAIGVLHHLTDDDADALFALAANVLRLGGRLVTCDGAYVSGQNLVAKFLLRLDRGKHVRSVPSYLAIAHNNFPDAAATVVHDLLTFPYTLCFIRASKQT